MGRTEHSLLPQWLKSSGNVTSGGRISNQLTSSSQGGKFLCFLLDYFMIKWPYFVFKNLEPIVSIGLMENRNGTNSFRFEI